MTLAIPGIAGLGPTELILIVLVLLLLFGGKKLPEVARGTGRALRIFKAETKGLMDDDDDDDKPATTTQEQLPQASAVPPASVPAPWPQQTVSQPAQQAPIQQPVQQMGPQDPSGAHEASLEPQQRPESDS